MSKLTRDIREAVRAALEYEGCYDLVYRHTGTQHQRFDFTIAGQCGHFTFASTPHSARSITNAVVAAKRHAREYREGRRFGKGAHAPDDAGVRGHEPPVQSNTRVRAGRAPR